MKYKCIDNITITLFIQYSRIYLPADLRPRIKVSHYWQFKSATKIYSTLNYGSIILCLKFPKFYDFMSNDWQTNAY